MLLLRRRGRRRRGREQLQLRRVGAAAADQPQVPQGAGDRGVGLSAALPAEEVSGAAIDRVRYLENSLASSSVLLLFLLLLPEEHVPLLVWEGDRPLAPWEWAPTDGLVALYEGLDVRPEEPPCHAWADVALHRCGGDDRAALERRARQLGQSRCSLANSRGKGRKINI